MATVKFTCVYAPEALTIKKFLKDANYDNCISYIEITNKLSKNDIYSYEPSAGVVGMYVYKEVIKSIQTKGYTNIFYVLSNMEAETISTIKDFVTEKLHEDDTLEFNCYVPNVVDYEEVNNLFDNMYELN